MFTRYGAAVTFLRRADFRAGGILKNLTRRHPIQVQCKVPILCPWTMCLGGILPPKARPDLREVIFQNSVPLNGSRS